ncbi:MAG: FAD-dependent oxidoreductase [Atopobiaceae bacterium]|jgi:uncharacterized FAD-dependent dehydrogenase|nr:FAD-dependent oxidoreductase [Atopobiaceae bacterium]
MIEVSNIRVPLSRLTGTPSDDRLVREAATRRLRLAPDDVTSCEVRRRSVDARRRDAIRLVYTCRLTLRRGRAGEQELLARLARRHDSSGVAAARDDAYRLARRVGSPTCGRIVVVGAGCAGLFCALSLANAGLEPLLVERGDDATRRSAAVGAFESTGVLDPESNIQFGLGGAGTFSDGKLTTGTRSPSHRLILETFAEAGASGDILVDARPHIGSDVLPGVVTHILGRIEGLGGEVRLRTRLVGLESANGRVSAVRLARTDPGGLGVEERVRADSVVLACGHSARDVFSLLRDQGVTLERKTFAMGARIEHRQADVDRALYGAAAGSPILGPAPYKLVSHAVRGRNAFTFCMCPGGTVVAAASEPGGVVTNGASLAARDGANANAALLANVSPQDLPGDDPLAGVELQRACERRAFELGGGGFRAPAQLVGDFLRGRASTGQGRVAPTYPRGVAWGRVDECLPDFVCASLRASVPDMARRLRGFDDAEAVLTAVESRSSSPVRVSRGPDGQSVSMEGLFPAGEGAGYAGGIMSAAADGLDAADALVAWLRDR